MVEKAVISSQYHRFRNKALALYAMSGQKIAEQSPQSASYVNETWTERSRGGDHSWTSASNKWWCGAAGGGCRRPAISTAWSDKCPLRNEYPPWILCRGCIELSPSPTSVDRGRCFAGSPSHNHADDGLLFLCGHFITSWHDLMFVHILFIHIPS